MAIRIYDIAKQLGVDSHKVLARAKELSIIAAKSPSSSLDKITADYLREEVRKSLASQDALSTISVRAEASNAQGEAVRPSPASAAQSIITLTVTQAELFCLAERIQRLAERVSNGEGAQFRLLVAEEEGEEILKLCLSNAGRTGEMKPKVVSQPRTEIDERTKKLLRVAYLEASRHNSNDDWVNLADYGNVVKKLEPTFQPQDFGERSLGSLLRRVGDLFEIRADENNPIVYYIREKPRLRVAIPRPDLPTPTQETKQVLVVTPSTLPKIARGKIHNLKLGFGFIMPDDGSENLFFHATDVVGCTIFDLQPGDLVEYEPGMNEKGPCGRKVQRLGFGEEKRL